MTTVQSWDCEEARPSLGVYVLGAIEPAELRPVAVHLECCPACRGEFDGLARLPALLALVGEDRLGPVADDEAACWPATW